MTSKLPENLKYDSSRDSRREMRVATFLLKILSVYFPIILLSCRESKQILFSVFYFNILKVTIVLKPFQVFSRQNGLHICRFLLHRGSHYRCNSHFSGNFSRKSCILKVQSNFITTSSGL